MYLGIVRETFAANDLFGTDKKKFSPHLTIAKTSKTSGKKRVKKIEPASYEKYKDEVFGTQIIDSLELLSMTLPPDKQGYYHCFNRELFTSCNNEIATNETNIGVKGFGSDPFGKESSLELLDDKIISSIPSDTCTVETICNYNQPNSRVSVSSENVSHTSTACEHNTSMVETVTVCPTATADKTRSSISNISLAGDGNSIQMASMPFSTVKFTPRVIIVREEANKNTADSNDQKCVEEMEQ